MKAVAYSNNSTVLLCWLLDSAVPDCLGFSIRRIDTAKGTKEPLPSMMPFPGEENTEWKSKTTDVWPIQKFEWKDFSGHEGSTYQYEIVPMCGTPGNLTAREDLAGTTNKVTLTTEHGDFSVAFTNGILSTQWL